MSQCPIAGKARRSTCAKELPVRVGLASSVCAVGLAVCSAAHAVDWNPAATLAVSATASDNAFLSTRGRERSDVILRTMPTIGLNRSGPRLKLKALYAPTFLGYVNGTVPDALLNSLNASANLEAVDDFFFVDARALMSQSTLSPLGVQAVDGSTNTANRVESRTVAVSPYIQGRISGGGRYELRGETSRQTYSAGGLSDTATNRITVAASDGPGSLVVMSADYLYSNVALGSVAATRSSIGRIRASITPDAELRLSANVGYENNTYGTQTFSGAVAGTNLNWKPSGRTTFDVSYEKRYFGGSYTAEVQHRTRLANFRLRAYRSEQELQNRATGTTTLDTRSVLNDSLVSRIPDAAARAQEVERLMQSGGLPANLTTAGSFITNRVNRVTGFEPSVAFSGVRNTLLLSLFLRETTPLTQSLSGGFTDVFANAAKIRQSGFGITLTHQLNAQFSALAGADYTKTLTTQASGATGQATDSKQQTFRTSLSYTVSPNTTAGATLRYMNLSSNSLNNVRERAMLVTLSHSFR